MTPGAIPTEAIVLAGGFGTRLRAVVSDVPKPLAPVAGRPFLHWLLDGLARQGIARVILATGYMGDIVRETLGEAHAGMALVHAREETPLGTGGALWGALGHVTDERAFVLNGDTWLGAPLAPLAAEAPEADLVLAVRPVPDRARYGSVRVDGNRILGLDEKGQTGPGLVNAGVYVARRDLPRRRPMPAAFGLEAEVLARPEGLDLRAHRTEATFLDIGTPDDFAAAQTLIPAWAAA
jgi:D-glycero-alpha-D-manno-heptose 1-phosphate guanylyltransferase